MFVKRLDKIKSSDSRLELIARQKKKDLPLFIVMVGLPGSGKSRRANTLAEIKGINAVVLSSDAYRESMLGSETDNTDNEKIFKALYRDARDYIASGRSVIIDATNVTMKNRRKALNAINGLNALKIAFVMNIPFDVCQFRNLGRERTLPSEVLEKFLNMFEVPMKFEGFDEILFHYPLSWGIDFDKLCEMQMLGVDQNTHWHKHNLLPHCIIAYDKLYSIMKEKGLDLDLPLLTSARIHDFGKLFSFQKKDNGEFSYHHHANVGAYMLLTLMDNECSQNSELTEEEVLEMIFYVNQHMHIHILLKEETKPDTLEKYKRLFGERLFNNLKLLEYANTFASGRKDG